MKLPKKLPKLDSPKSPAAVVTGQRLHKLSSLDDPKSPAAKVVGQTVRKLPSLADPKSFPGERGGGVSKG
jgi:hypothetical protein